jgi:hypothetical protein
VERACCWEHSAEENVCNHEGLNKLRLEEASQRGALTLYLSSDIRTILSRKMRCARRVACKEKRRNEHRIFMKKKNRRKYSNSET